jgi:hypothetical protein
MNFLERFVLRVVTKKLLTKLKGGIMLSGWKTYLLAIASVAYAVGGVVSGNMDMNGAIQVIQVALASAFLRNGIKK